MSKQGQNQTLDATEPLQQQRRPYQRPQLKDYGSVAHLTAGGSPSLEADGMSNMNPMEMEM
jgi:hypothetical protein